MARNNAVVSLIVKGKDATKSAFGKVRSRLTRLRKGINVLKVAVSAMVAKATVGVGKRLVQAFGRQEEAIIKVNAALQNAGKFSVEASEKIQKAAADIQKVTKAGDEVILEGTAMISELARELDAGQLIQAQKALVGLADTFFKGDLRSAAALLGKAIGSPVNALSRYGIQVNVAATQEEKLNEVLAQTIPLFRSSKAAATGTLGTMEQMANAYGDVQEEIGAIIVGTLNFNDATGNATNKLANLDRSLEENRASWVRAGKGIIATIKTITSVVRILFNVGQIIGNSIRGVFFDLLRGAGKAANGAVSLLNKLRARVGAEPIELPFDLSGLEEEVELADQLIKANAEDIKDTVSGVADAWREVASATGAATDEVIRQQALLAQDPPQPLDPSDIPEMREREEAPDRSPVQPGGPAASAPISADHLPEGLPTGSISFVQSLGEAFREAFREGEYLDDLMVNMTDRTLAGFGDAIKSSFAMMSDGSISAGKAFEGAMLGSLASVASGFGEFFLARATAALGEVFLGNPAGIAAAAKFTGAAGAMFALSGSLQGAASNATGGGAGRASARTTEDAQGAAGAPLDVYLEGDLFLDSHNPRSVDRFERFLRDVTGGRSVNITIEG